MLPLFGTSSSKGNIISREEVQIIFSNIVEIAEVHRQFMNRLESLILSFSAETKLGELFIQFVSENLLIVFDLICCRNHNYIFILHISIITMLQWIHSID